MYYLLHYTYVSNIIERREPYRSGHLALLKGFEERGELILAGAVGNPVTGASFVFKVESEDDIKSFTANDPYMLNDLVTAHHIEPWTVVIGTAYEP